MTSPLRIVIADDEPELLEDLQEMLEDLGHDVVAVAYDGHDLVARCRELQPQLVITDVKMANMDGLEAIESIIYQHPVPIIVVSAFYSPGFVEGESTSRVYAYLPKPLSETALAETIDVVMQRFRDRQAICD